jgi:diguanylate cyclase (GGDEF)-like protein/PAS domain S-box-containing protein
VSKARTWSRTQLRAVTDEAEDFFALLDLDFRFLFANRALARALNRDAAACAGLGFADLGIPAGLAETWRAGLQAALDNGQAQRLEFQAPLQGGNHYLQCQITPMRGPAGKLQGLAVLARDVTDARRSESLRRAQSAVLHRIVGGADAHDLMRMMVGLAEEHAPGRPCSLLLYDSETRSLRPGYAPGLPPALIAALTAGPVSAHSGCCGLAALHKELAVAEDLVSDPAWERHRELALAAGLAACWSYPILAADGELLGTFAMYHRKPRPPRVHELVVVTEMALLAALAIQSWRSREALLESRERLERALTASGLGTWDWDRRSNRMLFDHHAVDMMGYAPDEVQNGIDWLLGLVHPEDQPRLREAISDHTHGRTQYFETEFRGRTRSGDWKWIATRGQATQRDEDDSVLRLSGTHRDIDEQRRMRDRLDRANQRVKLLLEATDEGIVGIDSQGQCVFINPAATRLLGRRADELLGRDFHEAVRHTDENGQRIERADSPVQRCLREQERFRGAGEDLFWRDENTSFPVEYSVSPTVGEDNTVGAVLIFHDISDKRALAQQLRFQALHDPLTGLVNRRGFENRLQSLIASAKSQGHRHALCYLDLDQFKLVNDTCGHAAGDELLRQLPKVLQPLVRGNDTLARLGGDEFAVLLEDCPLEQAARIADSLRNAVRDFRFVWQYRTFTVGVSIGVVGIGPDSGTMVSVLSAADTACYVAKDQGTNNVHVSYPHDLAVIRRRGEMRWVARLKSALDENQFRLFFESVSACAARGPANRHELLLRLLDSKGDVILPGAFIPAAERYQLMPQIDAWVVSNAMRFVAELLAIRPSLREHCFGINLSGDSLRHSELLDVIRNALRDSGLPPSMIYFEITETAAIANLGAALELMRGIKQLGCQLALDDFGSGMSSFSYLKNLPVDFIKIDGAFVRDILENPVDQSIVRAVNAVAQQLGLKTIAEYVENRAIFDCVKAMGVDYAQGHGLCLPRPLEDLPQILNQAARA